VSFPGDGVDRAFFRAVIVKDFPVVKDSPRSSVGKSTQPENFTENLALYEVHAMHGA
jgi:hypothetical protein